MFSNSKYYVSTAFRFSKDNLAPAMFGHCFNDQGHQRQPRAPVPSVEKILYYTLTLK
jgi:hypothetical protein